MSNRQDKEREKELQPKRIQWAIDAITNLGFEIVNEDETKIQFFFEGEWVTFYPYSGWHTGKSIKDGRGLQNLLKQLTNDTIY